MQDQTEHEHLESVASPQVVSHYWAVDASSPPCAYPGEVLHDEVVDTFRHAYAEEGAVDILQESLVAFPCEDSHAEGEDLSCRVAFHRQDDEGGQVEAHVVALVRVGLDASCVVVACDPWKETCQADVDWLTPLEQLVCEALQLDLVSMLHLLHALQNQHRVDP